MARVDLKSEREEGALWVRGAWIEDGQPPGKVARELAEALETMSSWLGLERVRVGRKGNLARALRGEMVRA